MPIATTTKTRNHSENNHMKMTTLPPPQPNSPPTTTTRNNHQEEKKHKKLPKTTTNNHNHKKRPPWKPPREKKKIEETHHKETQRHQNWVTKTTIEETSSNQTIELRRTPKPPTPHANLPTRGNHFKPTIEETTSNPPRWLADLHTLISNPKPPISKSKLPIKNPRRRLETQVVD